MTLVSVVMAVYNDARSVRAAVYSILEQTFGDFEFVVSVDSGESLEMPVADPSNSINEHAASLVEEDHLPDGAPVLRGVARAWLLPVAVGMLRRKDRGDPDHDDPRPGDPGEVGASGDGETEDHGDARFL